ncbi:MAG TPA: cytochrome P450 [Streptosporangiaceae bacterium]|jgi:cytochrome P450|nr:cytochrome P450 [Streptosporangiaceae bacterium]
MADEQPLRPYPFEPFQGDLPDELLRMVRTQPVSRVVLPDGRPAWLVLGYTEVCRVLADPVFSRYAGRAPEAAAGQPCPRTLTMDGPGHASLRRLAARAFTPRHVESRRPRVQEITDRLLDTMEAAGPPADLVAGLVAPLPTLVTCELLGIRADDTGQVNAWVADMLSVTAYGSAAAARSRAQLHDYLAACVQAKRAERGDDLLSDWLAGSASQDLTDEEVVGLAFGVLLGGRELSSIAVGLRALFQHPAELAALRADPERLPAVVDEILRYTSVSPMFLVQTVQADIELGGETLRAGDAVMAVPWAANRDPTAFAAPGVFDADRDSNPHIAFGYGPHFCLGAAQGRLEVEVALGSLVRRFPRLAPAVPLEQLPWRNERFNCGIAEFPVTW